MAEMVVYEGHQYPANRLPPGADPSKAVAASEWFAANRRTKAVPPPVAALLARLRGEATPEHKAVEAPLPPPKPEPRKHNRGPRRG